MAFPRPLAVTDIHAAFTDPKWDGVIYLNDQSIQSQYSLIQDALSAQQALDARIGHAVLLVAAPGLPGGRLVHAPTGLLERDYDDVRRVYDVAQQAMKLAQQAGIRNPLLLTNLSITDSAYQHAAEVAYLGACQALWQPLEAREALGEDAIEDVVSIGLPELDQGSVDWLAAAESGRRVARDLCGTEPERMAPPKFAEYCEQAFANSPVKVEVISDDQQLRQDYPLLHAVARASVEVERHRARVIRLRYTGAGEIKKRLYFAGKGITFDTGGADLKVGGHMAGMSRDKGGAAAVAGFMKTLAELAPAGIEVVAELGAVRNSIGAEAFVPDEIIRAHCGKRVRIGNTDAEGRLVLADMLSHLREEACQYDNAELFTVATLTGHAAIALGPYTALVENGPARRAGVGAALADVAERWADPAEVSLSRREDFDFIRSRTLADDVISSNNAPSVATKRGHQFPMAFLTVASGLDMHGNNAEKPLAYTHVDIAGSGVEAGDWQHGKPTAAPVLAFASRYLRNQD